MGLSSRRDPAEDYGTYTASDTVNFRTASRRIHVLTGGVVQLVKLDGTVEPTPELPDNFVLETVAIRINESGTTASGFFVLH
jgi:hypothetical protein